MPGLMPGKPSIEPDWCINCYTPAFVSSFRAAKGENLDPWHKPQSQSGCK